VQETLSNQEKEVLLQLARSALVDAVRGLSIQSLDLSAYSQALREPGVCFVTLTRQRVLRGCIGALKAYQPLAEDVREHAAAAALKDYRFPPVQVDELEELRIEVSRLTPPQPISYQTPAELLSAIRPHLDGVTLMDGFRRATFLPQVWDKLPDKERFLQHLCQKMGAKPNLWREKPLQVQIYQVEEFHEK
jgi:AmmeMemoRadiSam system protein A